MAKKGTAAAAAPAQNSEPVQSASWTDTQGSTLSSFEADPELLSAIGEAGGAELEDEDTGGAKPTPETPENDVDAEPETDAEAEGEEGAEAEGDEDGEEAEAEGTGTELKTLKFGDREIKLSAEDAHEVERATMRLDDYTRAKQELSHKEQQYGQFAEQMRADYGKRIAELYAEVGNEQKVDWEKLRDEDPHAYLMQREQFREREAKRETLRGEFQRVQNEQMEAQRRNLGQYVADQSQKLFDKIPEWRDDKLRSKEGREINEFLISQGFAPDEIGQLYDHRYVMIARDAMRYRGIKQQKSAVESKVRKLAPVIPQKVAKPEAKGFDSLIKRAARSGRTTDALAVFTALEG
jgi:hypothetical protein